MNTDSKAYKTRNLTRLTQTDKNRNTHKYKKKKKKADPTNNIESSRNLHDVFISHWLSNKFLSVKDPASNIWVINTLFAENKHTLKTIMQNW